MECYHYRTSKKIIRVTNIHSWQSVNKIALLLMLMLFFVLKAKGQFYVDSAYSQAYDDLAAMLDGKLDPSFKHAVYFVENAYCNNGLSYDHFSGRIDNLVSLAKAWMKTNKLQGYSFEDSIYVNTNRAIFAVLKDTLAIHEGGKTKHLMPYTYDFDDNFGRTDWTKMFVSKLLESRKGNCHSMPYLYKILADELGAPCWLAFAPKHIYIRNRCQKNGWYNTELTSGQFPIDAWITASGYISIDAIRSGIYMDTLSNRQAIAQCVFDLAKGYERKAQNYTDSFVINCCNLVLKYHLTNINAIIYKAETLKHIYQTLQKTNSTQTSRLYSDMENLYMKAIDLGYKEMPEKMYWVWLNTVMHQKEKYTNKKVPSAVK